MWQLFHFPLCPFSRKVQLVLSEKKVPFTLQLAYPWEDNEQFHSLNPAGKTPVLHHAERRLVLMDSQAICEYFEETESKSPMIPGSAAAPAWAYVNGSKTAGQSRTDGTLVFDDALPPGNYVARLFEAFHRS